MFPFRKKGTVYVGLSGGVDSAVSAALLQAEGYDVTGVFIRISLPGYPCSAGVDKRDAMRVAAALRVPFLELDLSKEYEQDVFGTSIEEFKKGKTPNPDALCNREIKFGAFYRFAKARGADFVATGHYAQTKNGMLYSGLDPTKDQSYFLWMVGSEMLHHTLFPVGGMHKTRVRALAQKFKLPNAARKDSQGLCFLGDTSIHDMLSKELHPTKGDVLSEDGTVVGTHDGALMYTLGERHGFTLVSSTSETAPHFVVAKNILKNTITISPNRFPKNATKTVLSLVETNWIGDELPQPCFARFRYHQKPIPVQISPDRKTATLLAPHYVPEGQSLVLYSQAKNGIEQCFGGGIVDKSVLA